MCDLLKDRFLVVQIREEDGVLNDEASYDSFVGKGYLFKFQIITQYLTLASSVSLGIEETICCSIL